MYRGLRARAQTQTQIQTPRDGSRASEAYLRLSTLQELYAAMSAGQQLILLGTWRIVHISGAGSTCREQGKQRAAQQDTYHTIQQKFRSRNHTVIRSSVLIRCCIPNSLLHSTNTAFLIPKQQSVSMHSSPNPAPYSLYLNSLFALSVTSANSISALCSIPVRSANRSLLLFSHT